MSKTHQRKSELLMPAGSLERLKVAVLYGADAVYLGTPDMSLRTKSKMTLEDVKEGISFAHEHGVRVYLTLNLFTHNKDIPKLDDYIATLKEVQPDGVIIADPGVFAYLREKAPEFKLHVSTQANVCSWATVKFWETQGAELVVLAREVTFNELKEIREKCPDIRLESFIHGAMCMTYSGRCLLSNFMAERGANQGNCANSCRWQYKVRLKLKDGSIKELDIDDTNSDMFEFMLEEGQRPGELMPIVEDERGSYILNSKDMCMMPKLDEYLELGIDSLKVEGRNKSPYYVGVVARAYRKAIDDYYESPDQWNYRPYMRELETVANRGYTLAFHDGRLRNYGHNYENTKTMAAWEYAGIIREVTDNAFIVEVKNHIVAGDVLEFLAPTKRQEQTAFSFGQEREAKCTQTVPERPSDAARTGTMAALESVMLRMYEFELVGVSESVTEVHGGPKKLLRIPFALFDHEEVSYLKEAFPPYTIIRKENAMTEEEWARIKLDRMAQKIELGNIPEDLYPDQVKKLQDTISEEMMERRSKTSRKGTEGCCGKGCNGCAIFWNDPAYAKAREALAKKKHGEMLDRDGREG